MRADAIGAALLAAGGVYTGIVAQGLGIGRLSEPGAGFFPFVASALIVVCSAAIFFGAIARGVKTEAALAEVPPPTRWTRIWLCIAALLAYPLALPLIGFSISTFFLMVGLSRIDPKVTWRSSLLIGLGGAAGFWLVFVHWLQVSFPPPVTGF